MPKGYPNLYPPIFDICHCGKCNEIVYGGKKWKWGHNNRINNPAKRPEIKNKIAKTLKGKYCKELNPFYGKHHTKESKKKNSDAHKGINNPNYSKPRSDKTKKKISDAQINKIISEESKRKNSEAHKGKKSYRWGKPPSPKSKYGHGLWYKSPLQGKIYLRSSYELKYAKYLDENKILWMYEIETFNLGDTTYTPDFFLPRYEKFIEIKGYLHPEAERKINKFKEEYPFDLEILLKSDLIKLGIKL